MTQKVTKGTFSYINGEQVPNRKRYDRESLEMVERRDLKPCVGTVAGQDVGNTDKDLFQPLLYEGVGLNPPAANNDYWDEK